MNNIPVVIVPVLNQYEKANRLFKSFDFEIDKMIVIDNGNNLDWYPIADCVKQICTYRIPNNLGVAGSWNLGIKATAKSIGWMILNDDIYFHPGALRGFFAHAESDNIVECGGYHAFWLGSEVVKKIGIFHEGFYPAYFEDTDYRRRAQHARIKIVQSESQVVHEFSSTVSSSEHYKLRNEFVSWRHNQTLYEQRSNNLDNITLEWDLQKRLDLDWD